MQATDTPRGICMANEAKAAAATAATVKPISSAPSQGKAAKPELKPLKRGDASLREIVNNVWTVWVEAGMSAAELDMHAVYWNGLSDDVRRGDSIEAGAKDGSWYADFKVVDANVGRVWARLKWAGEGAPRLSAAGEPKPVPGGFHIERTKPGEPDGYIVIRESDGFKFMDSGMPWKTYQECYEAFLKHAIFAGDQPTKYVS